MAASATTMPGSTPYFPQLEERDCGATCLRMVAAHYGREVAMDDLRRLSRTDAKGATLEGIADAAEALGYETLAAELPYDVLTEPGTLPAILHWDRDHFVVVSRADFGAVTVLDPAAGRRELSRDDFEAHRYGPGRSRAGIILRPEAGTAPLLATDAVGGDDAPAAEVYAAPTAPDATRWRLVAASVFFAVVVATVLGLVRAVFYQAVDLQFREGWSSHLGVLLTAVAGFALAAYLLRREAIAYASASGRRDLGAIAAHLRVRTGDIRRPIESESYLQLMRDADDLRVWRAYRLPTLLASLVGILASLVHLLVADWVWGALAVGSLAVIAGVSTALLRYGRRNREIAREAQIRQREALYEYARVLPDVVHLDGGEHLSRRLEERNARAETSFWRVAIEYSSERQLIRLAMGLAAVALVIAGCYRLGYSGLQVADLVFGMLLLTLCILPMVSACAGYLKWRSLLAGRLRLRELGAPGMVVRNARASRPELMRVCWDGPEGQPQEVTFPAYARVALVGSDRETRRAIVQGMLGRPNARNARLYFDDETEEPGDLAELGRLSVIDADTEVASGSIAANIALEERPDERSVAAAAELVGLPRDAPPRGLHTLIGFGGEGIDAPTTTRVLVARAVHADVDALVLDGVTERLGGYAESLLLDELLEWARGRFLLLNPSRLAAAYGCDLVVHVEGGEVDAVGDHAELFARRGAYFAQFRSEETGLT